MSPPEVVRGGVTARPEVPGDNFPGGGGEGTSDFFLGVFLLKKTRAIPAFVLSAEFPAVAPPRIAGSRPITLSSANHAPSPCSRHHRSHQFMCVCHQGAFLSDFFGGFGASGGRGSSPVVGPRLPPQSRDPLRSSPTGFYTCAYFSPAILPTQRVLPLKAEISEKLMLAGMGVANGVLVRFAVLVGNRKVRTQLMALLVSLE